MASGRHLTSCLLAFVCLTTVGVVPARSDPGSTGGVPTSALAASGNYRVVAGDTITRVGQKTGKDWRNIASWNNLVSPYSLRVGQVLRLSSPDGLTGYKYAIHRVSASELRYSYRSGCPIGPAKLRRITLYYYGFDKNAHRGEIVVRDTVAADVARIFNRLYNARFPIRQLKSVDFYQADDDTSMAANNTSAFNCRPVAGTGRWSQHAYGTAIDLNPVQNPWVSGNNVEPAAGRGYLDRKDIRPGMIIGAGIVDQAFDAEGWGWGGDWYSLRDYQHYSANGQ